MANHNRDQNDDWTRRASEWDESYDYGGLEDDGPYVGIGPRGYQRSDERIFEEVCERLTGHGQIDARHIRVDVKDGEVTLQGKVHDRLTKRRAEQVLEQVRGVKDIHNQLRIESSEGQQQGRGPAGDAERGVPGGGKGRVDQVGDSGVYPASGPLPKSNAEVQPPGTWGQGERGGAGQEDSGRSETSPTGGGESSPSSGATGRRTTKRGS